MSEQESQAIIEIKNLSTYFGDHCVHKNLNLTIYKNEVLAIVGGSGSGKSTLLRIILMLQKPTSGLIKVFGKELSSSNPSLVLEMERRMGVMFQRGALFSSLTVQENVAFPLELHTKLPKELITQLALLKVLLVGLPKETAVKYPAELSGGMIKRVAVARAIAMDPELLFLDEPTAGLDPKSANDFDELIIDLQKALGLTIIMVTHDLDTLWRVSHRVAFLGEGKVLQVGTMQELAASEHPLIKEYFSGPRGRAAANANAAIEEN